MANSASLGDRFIEVETDRVSARRKLIGRSLIWLGIAIFAIVMLLQTLNATGAIALGFENWRPTLYAYGVFSVLLCTGIVLSRGERGWRALFILPAALFTLAMAIFPTLFGLSIAFTDWNLASLTGQKFNGLDNLFQLLRDPF